MGYINKKSQRIIVLLEQNFPNVSLDPRVSQGFWKDTDKVTAGLSYFSWYLLQPEQNTCICFVYQSYLWIPKTKSKIVLTIMKDV